MFLDQDAALRAQVETSMQVQETLAKNVNDGLLEIRGLRAKVERLTHERDRKVLSSSIVSLGRTSSGGLGSKDVVIADLTAQLTACQQQKGTAYKEVELQVSKLAAMTQERDKLINKLHTYQSVYGGEI
jgi:hypothetical protein